jgi:long-chain acyl-CoA synthetase
VQIPGEISSGNIGPPFLCSMYKLADVPEMNLVVSRDNRGEILIAGHNIFKGYYKDEEKTRAALDADGWYHSGDIGTLERNGCIRIVDRVKNIFKLQQGEYIAPEKIENLYVRSKFVAQVFVYGNSYKSSLVAVVVPEESVVVDYAKQNGYESTSLDALCKRADLKKIVLDDLVKLGKTGGLKGFEQVRDIYMHSELFTVDNGLLTPTMKSKRNEIQKYFQSQIDVMYKTLE